MSAAGGPAEKPDKGFDRDFCSRIFVWIQQHRLFEGEQRCLLAVSGGLDSMVLLDFLRRFGQRKYRLDFIVAHLDHGLRPDSAEVANWLSGFCAEHELNFVGTRLDVAGAHAAAEQSSLEAVAREQRYAWLEQAALQQGCGSVLTAHSASDQLETILMRLIRGGITGLAGMSPARRLGDTRLKRPLLGVTRAQIAQYASLHKIVWREDSSNQDTGFFRNRLRQQWLPWLRAENPGLELALAEQAEIWRDEQSWLQIQAQALLDDRLFEADEGFAVPAAWLTAQPPALQRALIKLLLIRHLGEWKLYGHRHIEAIRALAAGPGGKRLMLPGELEVSKVKKNLCFRRFASSAFGPEAR